MKITNVSTLVMGSAWRNLTYLKLTTDEGLTGVSEVRLCNRTNALLGYLEECKKRYILGSDPTRIELMVQRMFRDDYGRVGEICASAISLVEMACWDIVGKKANLPVYVLLGGAVRDRIKAYANAWYQVPRTPDDFARAAKAAVAKGYFALKFDPFGAGYYEVERKDRLHSVSLVEAVRSAVGPDVELLIEMHGRFSPATAIRISHDLEPFDPTWVEEPVPPDNLKALAKAAQHIRIPVATGERLHHKQEYRELFELEACDIIQPDITECCGLLEVKKIAAMADMHYITVAPHNVGGPVSTVTALHLAACTTNFKIQEHFNDFTEPHTRECATGCPKVVDGYFSLPSGPGLGITLNEDVIRAHPPTDGHFNLFTEDWQKRQTKAE
ncbi:MAG TPA: mandelate racemase/muconate lactonizing enzyme family protein [Gemmataceae bacterium]|jgi:galactonate dehydratase|nr:mandelate racemase/muconate lactonizing enzyme family protein [Gemmataceae bacterium]